MNKTKIIKIDFSKNWFSVILNQKTLLLYSLITQIFSQIFFTIAPLLIGKIFESKNYSLFYMLIITWLIALIVDYASYYYASILEVQCIYGLQYRAFEFFLTVDPLFHSQKQSGKLFAKIERASRGYEDFLDILLWQVTPIIIGVTTVIISFFLIDLKLGIISTTLLFSLALLSLTLNLINTLSFENNLIKADDEVKNLGVESLTQVQLIRSYFATDEISHKSKKATNELIYKTGTSWLTFGTSMVFIRLIYLLSVFILGIYVIGLLKAAKLSISIAITIIITYIQGTSEVIRIGRSIRRLLSSVTKIADLFNYIKAFGQQTFPVLAVDSEMVKLSSIARAKKTIHIQISDLHFNYPKAKIFENHSLNIEIPRNQSNKLYGIIGPSGMGKTTLVSILGGQLKPTKGDILINDVSVYDVDDQTRKNLIALQGQSASSLSGTIRKSLLLGIKNEKFYSDEELITVLKEVGIWKMFEEKDGLNTYIGEGGLTLSGGQRQRLNFASLYLRSLYYRPLVILIDEPTSSLDEVSEQAITNMISKLAKHALTLVIAHRIKTLKDAERIIDFSLIHQEKEIKFYTKEELLTKSLYFKKLIEGFVDIGI